MHTDELGDVVHRDRRALAEQVRGLARQALNS